MQSRIVPVHYKLTLFSLLSADYNRHSFLYKNTLKSLLIECDVITLIDLKKYLENYLQKHLKYINAFIIWIHL